MVNRRQIRHAEQDIERLLLQFTKTVQLGAELSLATFKSVWTDLQFSYIFWGNNTDYRPDHFIQCLYASALDGLDIPFWDFAARMQQQAGVSTGAGTAHGGPHRQASNASAVPRQASISVQQISNLMNSDESDDSDARDLAQTSPQGRTPATAQPGHAHSPDLFPVLPHTRPDPLADLQPMLGGALHQHLDGNLDPGANPIQQPLLPQQAPTPQRSQPAPMPAPRPRSAHTAQPASASRVQRPLIRTDPASVPFETKVASVYALYCLHETQPGKIPIYLPLELLLQLLPLLREAEERGVHDVGQIMLQLMKKKAIVIGAVRRPVRGSAAAEASAIPPSKLAASSLQSDKGAQGSIEREAKYHLLSTLRGLTIVDRLHGLCQGYKAAKTTCFAALGSAGAKPPPGIVKHTIGLKLGKSLSDATKAVDSKLYPPKKPKRKRKRDDDDDEDMADADDDPQIDADKAADDAELDNLLQATMADMQSDEEDAEGEERDEDDFDGLGDDEEDGGDMGEDLAMVRGKAARAVIQLDMKRKQQRRAAQLAWQAFEDHVLENPLEGDEEQPADPSFSPDLDKPPAARSAHGQAGPTSSSQNPLPGRHSAPTDQEVEWEEMETSPGMLPEPNADLPSSTRQQHAQPSLAEHADGNKGTGSKASRGKHQKGSKSTEAAPKAKKTPRKTAKKQQQPGPQPQPAQTQQLSPGAQPLRADAQPESLLAGPNPEAGSAAALASEATDLSLAAKSLVQLQSPSPTRTRAVPIAGSPEGRAIGHSPGLDGLAQVAEALTQGQTPSPTNARRQALLMSLSGSPDQPASATVPRNALSPAGVGGSAAKVRRPRASRVSPAAQPTSSRTQKSNQKQRQSEPAGQRLQPAAATVAAVPEHHTLEYYDAAIADIDTTLEGE